jgi:2-(1,2-epoxy-1,2-dihydrophenyl)acetyl-CoA isomerase
MPEYSTLELTQSAHALRITLNRPEVLNALSPQMLGELLGALEAAQDPGVRAVLLTGAGRGFCSGADLASTSLEGGAQGVVENLYNPVVRALASLQKPVVAAVNGVAAGAGMSLALACDLRLLSENASFALGFTRIGLVMDASSSYTLPRLVGRARALELAYTGRKVGAEEALTLGLGERLLPAEGFAEAAFAFAEELARGPTRSFALVKAQLDASAHNTLEQQLALEAKLQGEASRTEDAREGIRAFAEKRAPRFRGE